MKKANQAAHSPSPRPSKRGFTLVEILVVIAILIALAALVFTGFRRAKDNATAAVDTQDLRSIGAAVSLYASDHNGILPTTYSGVGARWGANTKPQNSLLGALIPYLGYDEDEGEEGRFFPEFAAASWQSERKNEGSPSLLVMHKVFSGIGRPDNISRPDPYIRAFGYPTGDAKGPGMSISAAIAQMSDPGTCLMLTEIDRLHPNFRGSTPGWLEQIPDGMAHGDYRLGLFWDGHVSRLDIDLHPK